MRAKNIIYLYSEVMPYAIAIMRALVKEFGVQVDCISWDEKKRTPFVPQDEPGIFFHKRSQFTRESIFQFIDERNPALLYVSGRMDKLYLEAASHFRDKYVFVTGSDNQWTGTRKQQLAALLSPILYKKYFSYFWVPGPRQLEYARRMGYPNDKILRNCLSADKQIYLDAYHQHRTAKQQHYPHNMVFAGRFAPEKGLEILIDAFTDVRKELSSDWTLTLIGSGKMELRKEPFINIKGFMSGPELAADSKNWGAFCLPSTYEPWGVVLHEFTTAGIPIISSSAAGAADQLVISHFNGHVFKSGDRNALKQAIKSIMQMTDAELALMGDRSHELSKAISPEIAAYSLMSAAKSPNLL